ncbi:hypothetical protein Q4549_18820 [Agarivorans sp. 2_MG-2023]|nr:hypothetical protein [Agarivorans sp. 2_MG-2023]
MKLSQVLAHTNQVERSKFVNVIDRLCQESKGDKALEKQLNNLTGQLKTASGNEITQLFCLVKEHLKNSIRDQISLGGAQVSLLVNILIRDGNCLASMPWVETLFSQEHKSICETASLLIKEIDSSEEGQFNRAERLSIYSQCAKTAFTNDLKANREAKISDDERSILNTLASKLAMTREEVFAIEHSIDPISETGIDKALEYLREAGVILISRRRMEVMIPEEIVELLHEILGKELHDKYILRILRSLSDSELSNILKNHGYKIRGVDRQEKIKTVSKMGVGIRNILAFDLHAEESTQNQRKERLKQLIEDMEIPVAKLGTRLQERIDVLIDSLKKSEEDEFNALSASGYKELLDTLTPFSDHPVEKRIRDDFEIENKETLDPDRLKALGITPLDILYLYTNEEIKELRNSLNLSRKGSPRHQILHSFASANDKLIENYELLATRDLAALNEAGIDIKEADLGVKFEEITKSIFEELGLTVDEDLRKEINTAKDKADIIISLANGDIIIGEVKSFKNGDFSKYSATSRQVKAYVKRCENNGHRVAQVLIVAPAFSESFVDAADMDTEINISLLEANGLQKILSAFKQRRTPNFSPKLLTKGGLLKAEKIAETI